MIKGAAEINIHAVGGRPSRGVAGPPLLAEAMTIAGAARIRQPSHEVSRMLRQRSKGGLLPHAVDGRRRTELWS